MNKNVTLSVLIKGKKESKGFVAQTHLSPKNGKTYIEGRKGSRFSLRIRNNGSVDVLAIPSVDGLSVMDGEPASENSSGYIVPAYSVVEIDGWRLDDTAIAEFYFAGKKKGEDDSYVARIGEDTANKGVIGLLVYERKPVPISNGVLRGLSSQQFAKGTTGDGNFPSWHSTCHVGDTLSASAASLPVQELGAGFGDKTESHVRREVFERGRMLEPIAIYYDNRRGLRQHGIDVAKKNEVASVPIPFPKMGCRIPDGWNG